jgi:fibronectin-binding autotransporter adhesin
MKAKTITSTITSICLVASIQPMLAASQTWNGSTTGGGTGESDTWDTTSANWVSPTTWPSSGTDNDALFDGTAGTVTISGGVTANDITFGVTGYTVTGSTLTLNGTTPVVSVTTGTAAIESQILGTAGLTKSGAGALELSSANPVSGIVTVNQGTLTLKNTNANNGQAVAGASSILIDGGTMSLQGGIQNALTASGKAVTVQNGGTLSADAGTNLTHTVQAITLNGGNLAATNSGSFYMTTGVTVGGSALSTVSGNLYLNGNRDFSVTDAVAGSGTDLLVSGVVFGNAGNSITKSGVGTMELSGANGFSGTVTVNQGTLILSNTNANNGQAVASASSILIDGGTMSLQGGIQNALTSGGKAVTIQNGGTLSADAGTNFAHNIQAITLNGGNLAATNGGQFYMNAGVTVGGSALSTVSANLFLNGSSRTFAVADAVTGSGTDLLVSGGISGISVGFTKTGNGTMELRATNSFNGAINVSAGTLVLNDTTGANANIGSTVSNVPSITVDGTLSLQGTQNALGVNGRALTIQNGGTVSADRTGGGAHTLAAVTMNGGNLVAGVSGGSYQLGGNVTVGGSALSTISAPMTLLTGVRTFDVADAVAGSATDLLVSGAVTNGGVTKTGAGTMAMSATNTYAGATTVNAGSLWINGYLPNSPVTVNAGTLGGTGPIDQSATIAAGAFVAPGTAGVGSLTLGTASLAGTYQCDISGSSADQLNVNSTLTVISGASVAFNILSAPTGAEYLIATYDTLDGSLPTFTGVPAGYSVDTATTGEIKLVQTGGGGFSSWADSWSSPALSDKTPGGDPDNDGISNLLEYVLGGDPRVSDTEILPKQKIEGGFLVLSYKRSDASEGDTQQSGQWSTDLGTWFSIVPVLVSENGDEADDMEIRIPLSNAVNGKLFGRLQVGQ